MGKANTFAVLAVLGTSLLAAHASGADDDPGGTGNNADSFAVVELFTSEGCSSCPAGEAAVASIRTWADKGSLNVYTIAWHVDYWDSLGWPDPYGSPEASDRQGWYARMLKSSRYTPQAIVNGRVIADYAGNTAELERIVRAELNERGEISLEAEIISSGPPEVIQIKIGLENRRNYDVEAVLVEEDLVTIPGAGENRNRELHHVSTVRSHGVASSGSNDLSLSVPPAVTMDNASVIVLVKPRGEPDIIAARRIKIGGNGTGQVSGVLSLEDGTLAAGRTLQFCTDTLCILATSNENGEFIAGNLPAGDYRIKVDEKSLPAEVLVSSGSKQFVEIILP